MVAAALKTTLLFWLSSCLVLFLLFVSIFGIVISLFTFDATPYSCRGHAGNTFSMPAKMSREALVSIMATGSFSGVIALLLLGVFMVLVVVVALRFRDSESDVEKQKASLEQSCSPEEEKLLQLQEADQHQQEPAKPALSENWQLVICLIIECFIFLIIFGFFLSWMFVSRDIAFFPPAQHPRPGVHVPYTCSTPPMWSIINGVCFVGICGWFAMGLWVMGSFMLLNKWSRQQEETLSPSRY